MARERGRIAPQPEVGHLGSVVFSPNGRLLATGGFPNREGDSPIYVWELIAAGDDERRVTARSRGRFTGNYSYTYALAFSSDGHQLASANQDSTVRIWDVQTGSAFPPIMAHTDFVYDVAFSPDGATLATLGRDALKLWPLKDLRKPE